MLALNFDPITTELVLKRVEAPSITLVGAQAASYTLNGSFILKDGTLVVDDVVAIEADSTLTIIGDSVLEIL